MKILIVNKFLFPKGGSETYIFKLGEQLKKLGHQVEFFGMEHEGNIVSNSANQYTCDMDFHNASPFQQISYSLKTIYSSEAKKKIGIVLKHFQPDIIHLNNFNYQLTPSILYAADTYRKKSGKKVKIVFTAHDYQLICPNHLMFHNNKPCENCMGGKFVNCTKNNCIHSSKAKSIIGTAEAILYRMLKTYKYIDAVICPSEFMKKKMDTNPVLENKTVVLHNFIENIKSEKMIPKQNYVLYFGRYSEEKGISTILDAKNISFICAGRGDLEEEINKAPHIKNVGFKSGDELEALIKGALCSVCPSTCYENCPFSVMESIMYGTPVIGANIGGIPELIDNGKTGLLFEASNAQDLEEKVNLLISNRNLAETMSQNCKNKSFDTVETYCEKLLKIYNK